MIDTNAEEAQAPPLAERRERLDSLKRVVVGPPRATGDIHETLLSKTLALPIFASDPLSSVAYATEAALAVLIAASLGSAHLVLTVSLAIAAVLAIVVLSYVQTVQAYETSGGAYVVAKENLGTLPSLVAAAALLVEIVVVIGLKAGDALTDEARVNDAFGSPEEIGRLFLTDHLLAFEITSIVLLIAAVGGVVLGTRSRAEDEEELARARA